MRIPRISLATLAVASLLAALPPRTISHAQSNAPAASPQATAPTLKVYTRETIVDITVTDAKGNPVHGLTRDDFTVKEDNKPQPIRSFHEYRSQSVAAPPKLPTNTYTNLHSPPATPAINILLLDFVNTASVPAVDLQGGADALGRAMACQARAKQAAMNYVAGMPPGTRVLVLGLSDSLRTLQGLTSDPALLSASIDSIKSNPTGRAANADQYFYQRGERTKMTLTAIKQIAGDLSEIKGKKNLLWFSVGMPWLKSFDLRRIYSLLAQAQIAVYPIDVRGVTTVPDAFFNWRGQAWQNVNELPEPAHSAAVNDYQRSTGEEQLAMEEWAEATGGTAYYNSNDLWSFIAKAVDRGANYYTLSYIPPGTQNDERFRNIKIEADRPALRLIYRNGYSGYSIATIKPPPGLTLALPADTTGPPDMRLQMTRAMPTSDALLFDVKVEPDTEPAKPDTAAILGVLSPKVQGKPLTRYILQYAILGSGIALPKGQGGLEFDLAAYDSDGSLLTSLRQAVKLSYTPEDQTALVSSAFPYTQQLDLPSGQIFLRIGVLDRTSNKLGTLELPLTVPKK